MLNPKLDWLLNEAEEKGSTDVDTFLSNSTLEGPKDIHVANKKISGPYGEIPIRIYQGDIKKPSPCFIYLHAGGWNFGSIEQCDSFCRFCAAGNQITVISIDYRLAPEFKFPTQIDEVIAIYHWLLEKGPELLINPNHMGIGGKSAGANIAISTCLALADEIRQPIRYLMLDSPALDFKMNSTSYKTLANDYALTKKDMADAWSDYLSNYLPESLLQVASPLYSKQLGRLPPCDMYIMEYDPLRDEAITFYHLLLENNVPVTMELCEGLIHGSSSLTKLLPEAKTIQDKIINTIIKTLLKTSPP
ncbi:MAG: acetyl esterase [Halieaceae bacterium]|jgi:acetyl esterase